MLLKRTSLKTTATAQEVLSSGTNYSQNVEAQMRARQNNYMPLCQTIGGPSQLRESAAYMPTVGCNFGGGQERYRSLGGSSSIIDNPDSINTYQNFLSEAPVMLHNLPASPDGIVTIELNDKFQETYSCALVIAVDKGSVAHYLHPLSGTNIGKRDLSLIKPLD